MTIKRLKALLPKQERHTTGQRGAYFEQLAAHHLRAQGLRLISRNYRQRHGEIDIIASDPNTGMLIFVEVRYRRSEQFSGAIGSIDMHKRNRLRRCAQSFLQNHQEFNEAECRFDALCIQGDGANRRIDWIRGAFDGEEQWH